MTRQQLREWMRSEIRKAVEVGGNIFDTVTEARARKLVQAHKAKLSEEHRFDRNDLREQAEWSWQSTLYLLHRYGPTASPQLKARLEAEEVSARRHVDCFDRRGHGLTVELREKIIREELATRMQRITTVTASTKAQLQFT